jgi:hypothetical protein
VRLFGKDSLKKEEKDKKLGESRATGFNLGGSSHKCARE